MNRLYFVGKQLYYTVLHICLLLGNPFNKDSLWGLFFCMKLPHEVLHLMYLQSPEEHISGENICAQRNMVLKSTSNIGSNEILVCKSYRLKCLSLC